MADTPDPDAARAREIALYRMASDIWVRQYGKQPSRAVAASLVSDVLRTHVRPMLDAARAEGAKAAEGERDEARDEVLALEKQAVEHLAWVGELLDIVAPNRHLDDQFTIAQIVYEIQGSGDCLHEEHIANLEREACRADVRAQLHEIKAGISAGDLASIAVGQRLALVILAFEARARGQQGDADGE